MGSQPLERRRYLVYSVVNATLKKQRRYSLPLPVCKVAALPLPLPQPYYYINSQQTPQVLIQYYFNIIVLFRAYLKIETVSYKMFSLSFTANFNLQQTEIADSKRQKSTIDNQKISYLLKSSGSAQRKKNGKKVAALPSPFFSTKSSRASATATVKVAPLQQRQRGATALNNPAYRSVNETPANISYLLPEVFS